MTTPKNLVVLTVGHSNHTFPVFLKLLQRHDITALADVRSMPYSRFNPHFNREQLKESLIANGIRYAFFGQELGGRSDDPAYYQNGRVQYTCLAQSISFRKGINLVIRSAANYRIALMCSEKEPLECHRTLLVARALANQGVEVQNILSNGTLESHEEAMKRLLDIVGLPHQDLFRSFEELVAEALAFQEERVAYVDRRFLAEGAEARQ
jgi:uncharacterized protein (DUF488 family)